ncbi:hypothetical protein A1O3_05698 [Capronia epimyces CBS 606.96]|uniref:Oligopeptide transporter n=1 Tax=Capronia epimyces CBS 606.96 TaxID=1182542 RepID=W9XXR7_9EURO|nr:uncharacterized protein A1O3_05698 [Capronia epimyces CBS 606.96]EXJ85023.1 hypothetical protein A1O3_05698 [Capronia epimyces CBS 606.96]
MAQPEPDPDTNTTASEDGDEATPLIDAEDSAGMPRSTGWSLILPCEGFAWRSVALGTAIGVLVCLTNIHFGLQTGYINIMSMPSALIGYGAFQVLKTRLDFPFSPAENVLIQTVASAVGAIPATAGLVGVIPALEFLTSPADGGPAKTSLGRLFVWSLGTAVFGLTFAALLRTRIILKERLRFPTGTATALMVNVLHEKDKIKPLAYSELPTEESAERANGHDEAQDRLLSDEDAMEVQEPAKYSHMGLSNIFLAMSISGLYTIVTYFLPILRNIPLFGSGAARKWLWSFNLSCGYFGQGVITGPLVLLNMLAGAVVGWAMLSPLAKAKGWAPGPVGDWDTGSRGWTIWVCLAAMLADALVDLVWFVAQMILSVRHHQSHLTRLRPDHLPDQQAQAGFRVRSAGGKTKPEFEFEFGRLWLASAMTLSIAICVAATAMTFGRFMPAAVTLFATVISLPLCVMGVKAVGATDHNPASGIAKICQLIVGRLVPQARPHAKLINLVAGGIAEAGAVQSGFMMQNFKTGHLSGSSPDTQFFGQVIGSVAGAIVASGLYKLYTSVYSVPGDIFQVPSAYVWHASAALAVGEGLPSHAPVFAGVTAAIFACFAVLRIVYGQSKWRPFIPMGIPFSVGMYNVPSFTLARALGGVAQWYWTSRLKKSGTPLMVFASGLILGEGLASIVNLGLEAFRAPHL